MTLLYSLLGMPRTFDEFLEAVKSKNERRVDITIATHEYDGHGRVADFQSILRLRSGKHSLKLMEHYHPAVICGFDYTSKILPVDFDGRDVALSIVREAMRIAEKLESHGLESFINGKKLDEVAELTYSKPVAYESH